MGSMDASLGTQLIGTWAITVLFVVEVVLASQYYHYNSRRDPRYLKVLVASTLVIDFAGLLGSLASVYLYCVTYWGDPNFLLHQSWPVPYCFTTGIIVDAIVQGFFVGRYLRLSRNWLVGAVLVLFTLATLGSGLSVVILVVRWTSVAERLRLEIPLKLWLILDVVTNIFISSALIERIYAKRSKLRDAHSLTRRLIIISLQAAVLPALCAIASLVAYLVRPDTNISAIFLWFLPRAYIIGMLYTLNVRKKLQDALEGGKSQGNRRSIALVPMPSQGETLSATIHEASVPTAGKGDIHAA